MRVNPNPMPDLLASLSQTREDAQRTTLELSSGMRISQPSDDPASFALLVGNHDQVTLAARYLQTIGTVQGQMQMADSTLGSIGTTLQRAITLGVEGANGTLSDADRAAVVTELQGIQSQLVYLANTSYQGHYIFSGTETTNPPFAVDPTETSGVRYDGNTTVNTVQIGDGYKIAVNKPGSQLFMAPGNDMFQAMSDLIQALQSNTGYETAVASVRGAFDSISAQRVFYGNAMNQATSQTNWLNSAKLQLGDQANTLGGADLVASATRLASDQTSISATLAAMGRYQQMSLFDYLK
jgi:flagellar hook-associated protein 3 FlgL